MANRKRKSTRRKRGGSSAQQATTGEKRPRNPKNNNKLVAFDFRRKKRFKNPRLHLQRVEEKLAKYLAQLKKQLSPEQYLMVLEAVASAGHHQRITDKVILKHLKAIHEII